MLFPDTALARAVTPAAVVPRLRVSTGASVEISVNAEVPPMLPVRLDKVTLPIEVLVLIVNDAVPVIFPEPVLKLTDFIEALPRTLLMAMPLELP